jgi:hypothetical protein
MSRDAEACRFLPLVLGSRVYLLLKSRNRSYCAIEQSLFLRPEISGYVNAAEEGRMVNVLSDHGEAIPCRPIAPRDQPDLVRSYRNGLTVCHVEMQPQWYAVFTMPRHEKAIGQRFEFNRIPYFLPSFERVSVWRNRQAVRLKVPLFPRYLFVRIDIEEAGPILSTPGVLQIVGTGHGATPIPD